MNSQVGKGQAGPAPPRCRDGVNSPHLPACGFHAPGDPIEIAPDGEPISDRWSDLEWRSEKSPVLNQPRPAFETFLSQGWGCPKTKDQAGHLAALANPANSPVTDTASNAPYGFAFHSHTAGTTTALLPSHEPVEPETDFTRSSPRSSLSAVPYRRSFPYPPGQGRRGTSPVWMFRHCLQVTARITRIVREDNRIQTPRESQWRLRNLLRHPGGSSQDHSGQNAPPRSNAGWPLRYAPLLERTGYVPPEPKCPRGFANVFCTRADSHR